MGLNTNTIQSNTMGLSKIALRKCDYRYLVYLTAGSLVGAFISFIFLINTQSNLFFFTFVILGLTVAALLGFNLIIFYRANNLVSALPNQQYPTTLDIHQTNHDAFIMIRSIGLFRDNQGLDLLIPYFKKHNYPFKIYHCFNPQEFEEILKNEHAKYLWIFGHGWRGGISFKWKRSWGDVVRLKKNTTNFVYSSLLKQGVSVYPKKEFIAQFHCNHFFGPLSENISLPEILLDSKASENDYFVSDNTISIFCIWFETRQFLKTIVRTPLIIEN
ncbi:MAG: hypothetical protein WCJ93_10870 [Methanomicrobiales archaeon]